jgi:hypothetical protein
MKQFEKDLSKGGKRILDNLNQDKKCCSKISSEE